MVKRSEDGNGNDGDEKEKYRDKKKVKINDENKDDKEERSKLNSEMNDGDLESIILAIKITVKDEHEQGGKAGEPEVEY